MTELLLLAAVAFAAGFCTGWSLRAALARADKRDEIIDLEFAWPPIDQDVREYFTKRGITIGYRMPGDRS